MQEILLRWYGDDYDGDDNDDDDDDNHEDDDDDGHEDDNDDDNDNGKKLPRIVGDNSSARCQPEDEAAEKTQPEALLLNCSTGSHPEKLDVIGYKGCYWIQDVGSDT